MLITTTHKIRAVLAVAAATIPPRWAWATARRPLPRQRTCAPGPGTMSPQLTSGEFGLAARSAREHQQRTVAAPFPPAQIVAEVIVSADTLEELATKAGLPIGQLTATIERFNGFARSGVDEDFHRGESAYDRYSATRPTRPNLGEISHAPYYAAKMVPGDLGTKGGIRTDVHARALRDDGTVINGLYAAGNVSAPVMGHTYPGPGGTIGPAMAFGYLAALHIAGKE